MTIIVIASITFLYPVAAAAVYPIYRKLGGRKTFNTYITELMN